jgi:hypothetical protein
VLLRDDVVQALRTNRPLKNLKGHTLKVPEDSFWQFLSIFGLNLARIFIRISGSGIQKVAGSLFLLTHFVGCFYELSERS